MRAITLAFLLFTLPMAAEDFGYTGGATYAVGGFRGQAVSYRGSDAGWHLGFLFQTRAEADFGYRATFTAHDFDKPDGASVPALGNLDLRLRLSEPVFLLAGPSLGLVRQRETRWGQADQILALGARVGLGWRMGDRWNLEFSLQGLRVGEGSTAYPRSPFMTWVQLGVTWTGFRTLPFLR